jgi:senataxin
MNVAITRAKQALWILGAAATLSRNPVWAALLADATQRGVVIRDAHAKSALPDPLPIMKHCAFCVLHTWTTCSMCA